jgi:hypothetical protein
VTYQPRHPPTLQQVDREQYVPSIIRVIFFDIIGLVNGNITTRIKQWNEVSLVNIIVLSNANRRDWVGVHLAAPINGFDPLTIPLPKIIAFIFDITDPADR